VYSTPPQTFAELTAPFPPEIRRTAEWLRELILTEFPQLTEQVSGGSKVANALYSVHAPERVALAIQPGERFVKFFVHDPDHLGESPFKLEGSGKHMRHIKFAAPPVDQRRELAALAAIPVRRRS
jgi:hypothetical protein